MANSDISGQITDGSGNPIGSAEVYLWREDLAGAGGVVASTTADSSGNFAFTAHPDGSGSSESWHVAAKDPNASVQLQSAYGVTASPPTSVNSQFDVSITGTNSPVQPGETLTVDASLTNSGTDSDTQTITLDVDNGVGQVDSSLEAAQGGASKTVPLSWSVPSGQTEQDYTATVSSDDDTASQTVTVKSGPTVGSSVSRQPDNNTTSKSSLRGLAVNPNTALAGVRVELSSNQGTISRLQVYDDANGTVLAQKTGSFNAGDVVDFTGISLSAGNTYSLLGDDQGNSYTLGFNTANISPQTSADIDIINARKGQAVSANNASVIVTVTALL